MVISVGKKVMAPERATVGNPIQWRDIAAGAQTERRGGAGPVRGLLGGKDLTGRFSWGIRYGGRTIVANRPTTSWLLLLLTEQLLGFRSEQTQLFEMRRGQAGHPLACYFFPSAGGSGKRHSCTTPAQ